MRRSGTKARYVCLGFLDVAAVGVTSVARVVFGSLMSKSAPFVRAHATQEKHRVSRARAATAPRDSTAEHLNVGALDKGEEGAERPLVRK